MGEALGQTWEQELFNRGQLQNAQYTLRMLLEERFGSLPTPIHARIEQTADLERLRAATRQVYHLAALSDLSL
jgi:hypothetical protein